MKGFRIALLMLEPPLPFGNAVGRWYHILLKGLSERGHRVSAFATCRYADEIEEAQTLFPPPHYDLRCYPHPRRAGIRAKWETLRQPFSFMFNADLRRDFAEHHNGRGVDLLHLEGVWSGWLGLTQSARALLSVHYLYQLDRDAWGAGTLRDHVGRQLACRTERRLLQRYANITALSPELSANVRRINPEANVTTIPLTVDTSLYPWPGVLHRDGPPTVSLIGSFTWPPTYSAALRVLTRLWPEIKRRVPTARLRMVGRDAKKALGALGDAPGVEVHEDVADTIVFFHEADVLLYPPVAGSGMKVKVLEAFALGAAVVTTRAGVEGLPAVDGIHAGVCEDDQGLVERTVQLLIDDDRRQGQRLAARALLESRCSPRASLEALEDVYERLCRADQPRRPTLV